LLQSPTGTGKTLCLLCATLAWMYHYQSTSQIFYASRTHSQLKQVFEQLKKTCYRPVTTILASRNHSCVKYKNEFTGSKLTSVCQVATGVKEKSKKTETIPPCEYYKNFQTSQNHYLKEYSRELCDIEDLFKEGEQKKFCPYYLQKKLLAQANIVFVPYTYLINPFIRERMEIDLRGKILIFDEAHNIEKQIEEANSYEFSLHSFKKCEIYFNNLNELIHKTGGDKNLLDLDIRQLEGPILNLIKKFSSVKKDLEKKIKAKTCSRSSRDEKYEAFQNNKTEAFPGKKIFDFYKDHMKGDYNQKFPSRKKSAFYDGIDHTNFSQFLDTLKNAYESGNEKDKHQVKRGSLKSLVYFSEHVNKLLMMDFDAKSRNVQNSYSKNFIASYKLCFSLETAEYFDPDLETLPENYEDTFFDLKIKLVCLNPGVGFMNLAEQKPHSFLLTSGTLTPLHSFESELMTEFPIQLVNQHVINREILQSKAFVVTQGPTKKTLDFSYSNRDNDEIISELGHSIINIAEKVPNGVLLCFSSYGLRDRCIRKWKNIGFEKTNLSIYEKLDAIKPIHQELKNPARLKGVIELYLENASTRKGASLFCICRGKVSEGIDFAGEMARAVFLIGIPLPPYKDPLIKAKKIFLNEKKNRTREGLTGKEWYNQEATRAFNQAIGRVIRHKDDYGLVFLCDQRYCEFKQHISNWIQRNTEISTDFGKILNQIAPFYQKCEQKFSSNSQTNNSSAPVQARNAQKRPGIQLIRDPVEVKRVLKTHKKPCSEEVDEFDTPADKIFDFLHKNSQIFPQLQVQQNQFPPFFSQQNVIANNATASHTFDLLNGNSTQETIRSNKVSPFKLPEEVLVNLEDSMDSCDSSDPLCEWCKIQQPLENFTLPSQDGRPVCSKCWSLADEIFDS